MAAHWRYDLEADAAYLRLSAGVVSHSVEIAPDVVFDYDASGRIVGMEVLAARSHLPPDALLAQ